MNVVFVTIHVVYAHGLQWVAKWSSHGLDYIHLEQECGSLAMVDIAKGQILAWSS
jgi:hypothetical protein